ncbi:MAG: sulfatase-like hydrolase/transferase [Hyphomicrobiaceae bacterium]|nr:MAG: sulfatase-like hydrolase/transferase [Hyphomicrobiaceae bacterium]
MADQTLGLPAGPSRGARIYSLVTRVLRPAEVSPVTAWATAAAVVFLMGRHFWRDEGELPNILFTAAVSLALISAIVVLARRVLFATVLTGAFVAGLIVVATAKHAVMNMVVHAYDLIFYLSSWSTIAYLWSDQRRYVIGLVGVLAAIGFAGWLAYRMDSTRVPRRWAALGVCIFAFAAWYGASTKGERRHMQFYFENLYVSSFYASWGETLETLWRGALMEAAPQAAVASNAAFAIPNSCNTATKPPHIILVHQESVVQPSLFPTLRYDHAVDPFFHSDDRQLHQLRVETYGGASWLTEFSLLAGVSTHSFGGMRQFVQTFTQNKLKDTVPQALERCGYRNVVFYPMMRNFVSNDRFYTSIGLKEIFDMKAQGAKTAQERDRFYYENALAEMDRHFKASRKPLFAFIQTMSAHWPYDFKFEPDVDVSGGAPGTDPEMHEYLRRLSMAKLDYDKFMSELRRRFPRERFLIVHYGDHHPMATRTLLGFKGETEAEDVTLDAESLGFVTYYAVRGINYRVPTPPQFTTLDVPYLGTVMLELAGLPLSDSHRERKRLMSLCKGRYNDCVQRDEILVFHRRLIDSGIMAAR